MEFPQFLWEFIPIVEMIFGYAIVWDKGKPGIWLAVSVYFSVFRLFFRHFQPLLTLTIMPNYFIMPCLWLYSNLDGLPLKFHILPLFLT